MHTFERGRAGRRRSIEALQRLDHRPTAPSDTGSSCGSSADGPGDAVSRGFMVEVSDSHRGGRTDDRRHRHHRRADHRRRHPLGQLLQRPAADRRGPHPRADGQRGSRACGSGARSAAAWRAGSRSRPRSRRRTRGRSCASRPGRAVNRDGRVLELPGATDVSLARERTDGAGPEVLFTDCTPLQPGTYSAGAGVVPAHDRARRSAARGARRSAGSATRTPGATSRSRSRACSSGSGGSLLPPSFAS